MKNLNELYLKNEEKKANKAKENKNLLIEKLARDIKKLIVIEDLMIMAEEMLIKNGCFKICHSGVIVDDKVYIVATEDYLDIVDRTLSERTNYEQIEATSEEVQELIGQDFINFWADRGVSVVFYFDSIFFVVNSLWVKIKNQCKKEAEQSKKHHNGVLFPGDRLGRMSKELDILEYVPRPFCYIE